MSTAYDQAVEFAMRDAKVPRRSSLRKPRPRGCKPKKRSVDFSPEVTMSSCSETSSIQPDDEVFFNPMPNPNSFKSSQQHSTSQQSTSRTMDVFSVSGTTQVSQPSISRGWSSSGAYANPAFDTNSEAKAHPVSVQSPRSPIDQNQQSKQMKGTARSDNVISLPVLQHNQQSVVVLSNGADMPMYYNQSPSKKPAALCNVGVYNQRLLGIQFHQSGIFTCIFIVIWTVDNFLDSLGQRSRCWTAPCVIRARLDKSLQLVLLPTLSPTSAMASSSKNIPGDMVNLRLILVSGRTKEFLFNPSTSAAEIAQSVFDNWPQEWADEQVESSSLLKLIYHGRFLHGSVTLNALSLPLGKTTVMHLVARENLPEPNSQDSLKKSKARSCCHCCSIS